MILTRIDHWIGIRLFQPPIIWLCQQTGATQWSVSAYCWLAAAMTLVARNSDAKSVILTIAVTAIALLETIRCALRPDAPRRSRGWFRLLLLFIALFDVMVAAISRFQPMSAAWDIFALTAEYAVTITNIPPRPTREAAALRKAAT